MSDSGRPYRAGPGIAGADEGGTNEFDRDVEGELLDAFVEESPRHVTDVAAATDRHPITVEQTCVRLHDRGYIAPLGQGVYRATAAGKRRSGDGADS